MSEREAWQLSGNAAEMYEKYFVPAIFQEWAPRTADAANPATGGRVLDVACGTGVVARECLERVTAAGKVVGFDINPGMLAVARGLQPAIEWQQGDVASLPFGDGTFDAVTCQFALMFFPDRVVALREMWRVLAPGGRLAVAVWGPIDDIPAYVVLADLTGKHASAAAVDVIRSPFVLGDKTELTEIFRDAGLEDIEITTQNGTERFASTEAFLEIEIKASPAAELVSQEEFEALRADALAQVERFAFSHKDDGRIEFATFAHVVSLQKA